MINVKCDLEQKLVLREGVGITKWLTINFSGCHEKALWTQIERTSFNFGAGIKRLHFECRA